MSEEVTRRRYRRGGGDKDQGDYYSVVSTAEEGQLRQLDDDAAKENESCSGDDGLVVKISDAECSSESLPQPQDDFRAISDCDEDSFLVTAAIESASLSAAAGNRTYLEMTLFPDDQFVYRNIVFADGEFAIKLIKFTVFTFVGICFIFYLVRWMEWENDESLRLRDVWRYEGNLIITDILFFFVVGRLFRKRGVDHLSWLGWCMAANFYSSYLTDFATFRHSFTMYEMHCRWPWQLWVFVILLLPVLVTIGVLHLQRAWRERIVVQKCLEMIFCLTFLLAPLVTSPFFHFHHWFAGFLVGMHLNFDVWWSRAAMAWCWGCYINGIAVYGRDPVLTCAYAYFITVTQRCPFVKCYLDSLLDHPDNTTVTPMKPPNWRNCSADAFHP